MHSRTSFSILTAAYSLTRRAGLLERSWARRAFVSSYFFYKKFWEDPFAGLVRCRPGLFANGDVLDIGANIGYTSCLFAGALTPGSKVYSFEPDQFTFQLLEEVLRRRNLQEKIEAIHTAVGSSDGYVAFCHNERHSGDHRVATDHFQSFRLDPAQISTIPVVSVDSFVRTRELRNISFIKMDVQGYELAVCEGMKETLTRFPELTVCFEYAPEALTDLGFDPLELLDFFRTNHYQLHLLSRSGIRAVRREDAAIRQFVDEAGYVDLLCSRKVLA